MLELNEGGPLSPYEALTQEYAPTVETPSEIRARAIEKMLLATKNRILSLSESYQKALEELKALSDALSVRLRESKNLHEFKRAHQENPELRNALNLSTKVLVDLRVNRTDSFIEYSSETEQVFKALLNVLKRIEDLNVILRSATHQMKMLSLGVYTIEILPGIPYLSRYSIENDSLAELVSLANFRSSPNRAFPSVDSDTPSLADATGRFEIMTLRELL